MTVIPLGPSVVDPAARDRRILEIAGNLQAALHHERTGDRERAGLDKIDAYMRGCQDPPYKPDEQDTDEYKAILKRSVENILPLIVGAIGQTLHVTGYRRSDSRTNAPAWSAWQANGWDSRQRALHHAALTYGIGYSVVLPASLSGTRSATMRAVSPRHMIAVYDSPADDEWPVYALEETSEVDPATGVRRPLLRLFTDGAVHTIDTGDDAAASPRSVRHSPEHRTGLTPVVRFGDVDLEGRYLGEVEPLLTYQDQVNQASFDEAVVRSYGAFIVKTLTGGTIPGAPGTPEGGEDGDEAAARAAKLRMGADRILYAHDHEARWGSLPATPLEGHLSSHDNKLRNIALRGQLPPHALLGGTANISAEALAATEAGMHRKGRDHRLTLGECHERALRLVAWQSGDRNGWDDHDAAVMWGDTEARSLAQVADAIVKLGDSPGLRVDPDLLLPYLPGWTQLDVEQARKYREQRRADDPLAEFADELRRQGGDAGSSGGVPGNDPASREPTAS